MAPESVLLADQVALRDWAWLNNREYLAQGAPALRRRR
jgi:hypothetical protein